MVKSHTALLAVILIAGSLLRGQAPPAKNLMAASENGHCSSLVGGDPDGDYIISGTVADVPYANGQNMDVYAPPGEPRPAAIVIRGHHGSQFNFVTKLYEQLKRSDYAWFAPDYRDLGDVAAAIRFIRCPGRFNISQTLVLIGEDNGAAIALKLAKDGGANGVVTIAASLGDAAGQQSMVPDVPVLMIQGDQDKEFNAPKTEAFCRRLKSCSVYVQSPAPHVFEQWHPQSEDYREELDAWLRHDRRGLWKDISYSRPGGRDLPMDAFVPKGAGPFPAVIVIHGGGFARDKVTYIAPIFEPLAKADIAWFSIDYTAPTYIHLPEMHDQVRAAIRYVKKHAARYHVDPNRLAVMGESFSAPMATVVASKPCPGCEVQAVLSFYGNYRATVPQDAVARARLDTLYGAGAWTPGTLHDYAPYDLAHPGMPPVLVLQGTAEQGGPARSKEYCDHLKELGVPTELVLLEGAPHGIENWEEHPEWAFYKTKVVDWLKATWH
jgi:acetyl esterase